MGKKNFSECVMKSRDLTVFEDEPNGIHEFPAEEHDGIVPAGAREHLRLSVGVQDEVSSLVQELLIGRADVSASEEQLLEKCGSVGGYKNKSEGQRKWVGIACKIRVSLRGIILAGIQAALKAKWLDGKSTNLIVIGQKVLIYLLGNIFLWLFFSGKQELEKAP